ncbi:hypothetical protein T12_8794, partial [Trichinella patagoniensis]
LLATRINFLGIIQIFLPICFLTNSFFCFFYQVKPSNRKYPEIYYINMYNI